MNRAPDKILSLQIAGLQAVYWMTYAPIASFAAVYLLSKDFSNQQIGWVLALGNVFAILLQPALGMLIDRFAKFSPKSVLSSLALLCVALLAGLIFVAGGLVWMMGVYVAVLALFFTMQPLVNALIFEYINAGHDVSFGTTRAMGSISFALLSSLLGIGVTRFSTGILPIVCIVLFLSLFLLVISFPPLSIKGSGPTFHGLLDDQPDPVPAVGFLRKYERFTPFLIAIVCLFIFHTVINNFLAQIMTSVGGQNTDIGVSLTIAALCELPALLGFSFLISKFSMHSLLKLSGLFYALRSFIYLLAASVWMINLGQVFQALSFAVFVPASVYYVNEIMGQKDRVKGQTLITGAITLGNFIGSVMGGWLLDLSGVPLLLTFGAVGAVAGCLVLIYSVRKARTREEGA